jgi:3' terminal RNA ribose 2'-O-methyltransferase Hen1
MFLSITTTHRPASDLGFLLRKNPAKSHVTELSFGTAITIYPEANEERCTAALIMDVDPVGLVRGKGNAGGLMDQYVNDRPYAASSFLSVAMGRAWREAIADSNIPLEAHVTPLPARGGQSLIRQLFEPLGYDIEITTIPLGAVRPDWGLSPYVSLNLKATTRLSALLTHLYVLIPVLDDRKHYFVGEAELEKLLAKGEGWLAAHPAKDLIVTRYLKRRKALAREALLQLAGDEADSEAMFDVVAKESAEAAIEKPLRLHDLRLDTVAATLKELGAKRVLDLGCGEGKLIWRLLKEKQFDEIVGVEVSSVSLARAAKKLESEPERQRDRVQLLQGALIYKDARLRGYDAAALVEVIEHVEPDRLHHLELAVFGDAKPKSVVVTTPNADYNSLFATLPAGQFRHADHRFEWSRAEFAAWCERVGETYGYRFEIKPLGEVDTRHGAPSQMGVFQKWN